MKPQGRTPKAALLRNRYEVSEMPKFQSESSINCGGDTFVIIVRAKTVLEDITRSA
jgi:hypothetical protein